MSTSGTRKASSLSEDSDANQGNQSSRRSQSAQPSVRSPKRQKVAAPTRAPRGNTAQSRRPQHPKKFSGGTIANDTATTSTAADRVDNAASAAVSDPAQAPEVIRTDETDYTDAIAYPPGTPMSVVNPSKVDKKYRVLIQWRCFEGKKLKECAADWNKKGYHDDIIGGEGVRKHVKKYGAQWYADQGLRQHWDTMEPCQTQALKMEGTTRAKYLTNVSIQAPSVESAQRIVEVNEKKKELAKAASQPGLADAIALQAQSTNLAPARSSAASLDVVTHVTAGSLPSAASTTSKTKNRGESAASVSQADTFDLSLGEYPSQSNRNLHTPGQVSKAVHPRSLGSLAAEELDNLVLASSSAGPTGSQAESRPQQATAGEKQPVADNEAQLVASLSPSRKRKSTERSGSTDLGPEPETKPESEEPPSSKRQRMGDDSPVAEKLSRLQLEFSELTKSTNASKKTLRRPSLKIYEIRRHEKLVRAGNLRLEKISCQYRDICTVYGYIADLKKGPEGADPVILSQEEALLLCQQGHSNGGHDAPSDDEGFTDDEDVEMADDTNLEPVEMYGKGPFRILL